MMECSEDHGFVGLLVPGLTCSDLDLQQLLADTEEKLQLNASSIEQSLKELQASRPGEGPGSADRPPSPSECLQWLNPRSPGAARPSAAGHQEVMDFLKALVQYLRSPEEGREEVTLQLLMDLSSQCGVSFPCTTSSSSNSSSSSVPMVHAVRDESSLEFQEVWDDVRLLLRRRLLDRLSSCGPEQHGPLESRPTAPSAALSVSERVRCLQELCFLYPQAEVLVRYQAVRSQWAVDLLRSALTSTTQQGGGGGGTGFDRLAAGFRSAAPALAAAIGEEFGVLAGAGLAAEPHAALAFLNATHLDAVGRELASAMEREREAALKDNTVHGGRARKCSARSTATVAPMELPKKGRNFSLTSHQLGALTQLAGALLEFEGSVEELATNMAFINCAGEMPGVKGILKKSRDESDVTTVDGSLLHRPEAVVLELDWRSAFRGLVPQMAHCVKVVLDEVCAKTLQHDEDDAHIALCHAPVRDDSSSHTYAESETPKMIAKFCGAIMGDLDALLPLAVACREPPLLEVRCGFVEACGRATCSLLERLERRAPEVPSSAPLRDLPALLASCVHVHQRLVYYHQRLRDHAATTTKARAPLTLLPVQRYQEAAEALREQLTSYCVQVCSTSILQDAESHHWADPKPFYEGERCSFSVQMWWYFLCGLRSDLWAVLPGRLARAVLGQVLCETLQLLVQRYAGATPSYKRHLQIRCDITAVLLYTEQLMWSVCDSPEAVLGTTAPWHPEVTEVTAVTSGVVGGGGGGEDCWPAQIHSLCQQLLAVMVVVTAPLEMLHSTFVSASVKDCTPPPPDPHPDLHWLTALHPDTFALDTGRDRLTSVCQLRLLTSDPGSNPKLLLRALLHHDCHLPIVLLENSHFCRDAAAGSQGSRSEEEEERRGRAGDDFMEALFNLLCSAGAVVPRALTQALVPYLDHAQLWEHLHALPDRTRSVPAVVSCIQAVLSKATHGLLGHLVSMVTAWQGGAEGAEPPGGGAVPLRRGGLVPESVLSKVPKEWSYSPPPPPPEPQGAKDPANKGGVISLAIQAVSLVLVSLPAAVSSVPLPLRYLFHVAERRLSSQSQQRSTGLLPWALLGCLVQGLVAPEETPAPTQTQAQTPEQTGGPGLDRRAKDRLALLAECLQATMGIQQKGVPKPTVNKVLQALEEKRPKWTSLQLQRARKLCSHSVFERGGGEGGGASSELTEQKMLLMLLEVCHKAGGSDYLRQIHHIIQGNEELLMRKLTATTGDDDDDEGCPPRLVTFDLGCGDHAAPPRFNPLTQFDHVGNKRLDQGSVAEWAWRWPRLLPAYQAMRPVTFTTLLANRWEMQEGAVLEDEEKVLVEELQRVYF